MKAAFHIACLFILFLLQSCANIVAPTGGPKDEKAPLIRKRSLQDSAYYFKGGKIQFEFNEMIQLRDINTQLVITPMLSQKPKVTVHKKRATIYIPDSLLLPNTTYKVSFGNAIQDLNEGNAAENLSLTFSTGGYFDSLRLQGTLYEAATGKPDTGSWILLYPAPVGDSVLGRQKPMYAQKVNNGSFRIENLPARDFAIYSLRESNNNLRYDAAGEAVSFYNNYVNPADTNLFIRLYSFEESDLRDTSKSAPTLKPKEAPKPKDQVFAYTVNVDTTSKIKRSFDINDSLRIMFNDSVARWDPASVRLYQGEQYDATATVRLDSTARIIIINTDWVQDATYSLQLLKSFAESPGRIQAIADTFVFKTRKESDYGFLQVSTTQDTRKMIELLKDGKVVSRKAASDTLVSFPMLIPGSYSIRVLDDKNGNGTWDSGDLFARIMPEIVILYPEPITVKANWGNKISLHPSATKTKVGKELKE